MKWKSFGEKADNFHNEIYFPRNPVVCSDALKVSLLPLVLFLTTPCGEILFNKNWRSVIRSCRRMYCRTLSDIFWTVHIWLIFGWDIAVIDLFVRYEAGEFRTRYIKKNYNLKMNVTGHGENECDKNAQIYKYKSRSAKK